MINRSELDIEPDTGGDDPGDKHKLTIGQLMTIDWLFKPGDDSLRRTRICRKVPFLQKNVAGLFGAAKRPSGTPVAPAPAGPSPQDDLETFDLITEEGDFLVTENGDNLVAD